MAQTDIDVVNIAGAKAGADKIDAIDEETPFGQFCLQTYQHTVEYILGLERWNFATRIAPLTATPAGSDAALTYAYLRPADVVGSFHCFRNGPRLDAERVHAVQLEKKIFSEVSPLHAEYTRRVPEADWPIWFTQLVTTAFAAEIALGHLENRLKARELAVAAWGANPDLGPGGLHMSALTADGRDAPQRRLGHVDYGPLVDVRRTGSGDLMLGRPAGFTFLDPPE